MHIVHSALQQLPADNQQENMPAHQPKVLLRYHAYQAACDKYRKEIIAIQQYMPGWMPAFR